MNTTDCDKNTNYFEKVKKTEQEQKCFDKTNKLGKTNSLRKNKGYDI